jgi:hypothetical protein
MRVVHEHGHGAHPRNRREQAQRRGIGREAIDRAGRRQTERRRQRAPLSRWDLVQPVGDRRQQRREPGVRKPLLRLEGTYLQQPHVGRLLTGVREQHALADARLAADHERAAPARARLLQQPVDRRELRCTIHEHPPILCASSPLMEMSPSRAIRLAWGPFDRNEGANDDLRAAR